MDKKHNCRIGKTYFQYASIGYGCDVKGLVKRLSPEERARHAQFIIHLIDSGKIDKTL